MLLVGPLTPPVTPELRQIASEPHRFGTAFDATCVFRVVATMASTELSTFIAAIRPQGETLDSLPPREFQGLKGMLRKRRGSGMQWKF
jgi:hypothetical protein